MIVNLKIKIKPATIIKTNKLNERCKVTEREIPSTQTRKKSPNITK